MTSHRQTPRKCSVRLSWLLALRRPLPSPLPRLSPASASMVRCFLYSAYNFHSIVMQAKNFELVTICCKLPLFPYHNLSCRWKSTAAKSVGPRMQASESVPFLTAPPKLSSSMAGYVGFDPLRISDSFDVKWLQVCEIFFLLYFCTASDCV